VQAYKRGIVLPNKHVDPPEKHYDGHLLESETYVGGHVEALEAGVFRKDIPIKFEIDTTAIDEVHPTRTIRLTKVTSRSRFSIEI
jgi:DNA polymerase epsilon subunit 1